MLNGCFGNTKTLKSRLNDSPPCHSRHINKEKVEKFRLPEVKKAEKNEIDQTIGNLNLMSREVEIVVYK